MSMATLRESARRVLDPVVSAHGFDLEDVVVTPAGRRRLLRVVVDSDKGVGLDDIATISTSVSATLDESDVMGATPYVLEVTSPGVDRPLTHPRHWRRSVDRLVEVDVAGLGERSGRLVDVDHEGVRLADDGGSQHVRWADLGPGHVQVEFKRKEPPWTST